MANRRSGIGDPVALGFALNIGTISRTLTDLITRRSASLGENYVTVRSTARGGKRPAVSKRFVPSIGSQRLVKLEEGGEATYLPSRRGKERWVVENREDWRQEMGERVSDARVNPRCYENESKFLRKIMVETREMVDSSPESDITSNRNEISDRDIA